jgi:hypothetical protein
MLYKVRKLDFFFLATVEPALCRLRKAYEEPWSVVIRMSDKVILVNH